MDFAGSSCREMYVNCMVRRHAVVETIKHYVSAFCMCIWYIHRPGAHGAVGAALAAPTFSPKMEACLICGRV